MKTKNSMQLKAFIKNMAAEKKISAQLVMQNYVLERLLMRISISKYKRNFILKGGFLISLIVGVDTRATMDLDTNIKGFDLTHEVIRPIFEDLCKIEADDGLVFELLGTSNIRKTDAYPGLRVNLKAIYPPISVPLNVDVTTGDKITPCENEYTFTLMFNEQKINIMTYPLETVLAEKLETIVSRGIANTRPRDFYDIYILLKMRGNEIRPDIMKKALAQTSERRGSAQIMVRYDSILADIIASEQMQRFWTMYKSDYEYAKDIAFEATIGAAKEILDLTDY
jgi:predicted nucleotidyltransferase component of viral defense system